MILMKIITKYLLIKRAQIKLSIEVVTLIRQVVEKLLVKFYVVYYIAMSCINEKNAFFSVVLPPFVTDIV